jgi:N4-gp56 family major capsid protein
MILTSTLQNQYQRYFNKKMLEHQQYTLQLDQYAMKADLPKEAGARYVSFFRQQRANRADVQQLAEGVPISVFKDQNHTRIDFELQQYGEASRFSDILTATQLLDNLKIMHETMAEDAALQLDSLIRDALVSPTSGLTQRYAGGGTVTSFATLGTTTNANGQLQALDLMDATTQLRNQLAPTIGGWYFAVVPPVAVRDFFNAAPGVAASGGGWLLSHQYGNDYAETLKKGEIGTYAGIRTVVANNPFIENATSGIGVNVGNTVLDGVGTMGTNAATAPIYSSFVLGRDAYGVPALSGDKPKSPSVIIVDDPDSANPLAQFITIGWKLFYAVGILNPLFGIVLRSKSAFNGAF